LRGKKLPKRLLITIVLDPLLKNSRVRRPRERNEGKRNFTLRQGQGIKGQKGEKGAGLSIVDWITSREKDNLLIYPSNRGEHGRRRETRR